MRLILKVTSSNEYCDGGCEFALVDLTPELARLTLSRIAALREQRILDPNIDEVYYWAYFVACYFSFYAHLAVEDEDKAGESAIVLAGDLLDELQIQNQELVCVPECFQLRPDRMVAVECEKMIVGEASIAFTAIPKHASFYVQTVEIPITMLEAALAISASTTRA
jgi:hypothetical protein